MKKIIFVLILSVILSLLVSISSLAYSYSDSIPKGELVTDKDGLIPDKDEAEISAALAKASENSGVDVRVYAYSGYNYYDYMDYLYESEDNISDLVLLVIQYEAGTYYYYLDTYGAPHSSIKNKEVDRILYDPAVFDNIKSGNLKDGAIAFASLAEIATVGALRPKIGKVILISAIIAAVAAFIICLSIFIAYKRKKHSPSYPLERYASLNLKISRDDFVTKTVTRVRINTSSSGGRSGGGGGGGRRGGR